jgi:hypothetical protein
MATQRITGISGIHNYTTAMDNINSLFDQALLRMSSMDVKMLGHDLS